METTHKFIVDETHGEVSIGKRCIIESTAVLIGPLRINNDVYIGHHAVIGAPAQYRGVYPARIDGAHEPKGVRIESDVCIRELAQVHQGVEHVTLIKTNTMLMAGVHVAHDVRIGEYSTIGSFTLFGGHTYVGDRVTFGQGVVTHPWVCIGDGSMVGMNSSVIDDVMPYQKVAGCPTRVIGDNSERVSGKPWTPNSVTEEEWDHFKWLTVRRDAFKNRRYAQ